MQVADYEPVRGVTATKVLIPAAPDIVDDLYRFREGFENRCGFMVGRFGNAADHEGGKVTDQAVEVAVQVVDPRSGEQVRITAQLIRAVPERHLWADTYDRSLGNILSLFSDVAKAIAREIKITLTPKEQAQLAKARPVIPEAYELYLKAMVQVDKFTLESHQKAAETDARSRSYLRSYVDRGDTFSARSGSTSMLAVAFQLSSTSSAAPQFPVFCA